MWQGGNPQLKPETSKQWNAGFVWSPTRDFSAGVSYWSVHIEDGVSSVSEELILDNPGDYLDLYTTKFKASSGLTYVAILEAPTNIGRIENEGFDWDVSYGRDLAFGRLAGSLAGTHLAKSRYTMPGTADEWATSLGQYGVDDLVSFDDIVTASLTLRTGRLENTLLGRYRSGYKDVQFTEDDCVFYTDAFDCAAGGLDVRSHAVFDWRTTWRPNDELDLTFGIENLFDRDPPRSLRSAGPHQLGYDPHYASPYLRTFVFDVAWRF
jgi:iron complex outermembrane receptor protein